MTKEVKTARTSKKKRKVSKRADITTTSISFKTKNIEGLKDHELVREGGSYELPVSTIVNRLVAEFLAGNIKLNELTA